MATAHYRLVVACAPLLLLTSCEQAPQRSRPAESPAANAVIAGIRSRFTYDEPKLTLTRPVKRRGATPPSATGAGVPQQNRRSVLADSSAEMVLVRSDHFEPSFANGRNPRPHTALSFPTTAERARHISDSFSGVGVDIALEGSTQAAAETAAGFLVYRHGESSGADVVIRPEQDGFEDLLVFENSPQVPKAVYKVSMNAQVAGLRLVGGSLEFLDSKGVPRVTLADTSIVDITGHRERAPIRVTDCKVDIDPRRPNRARSGLPKSRTCTVVVEWDPGKVRFPALLDPTWTNSTNSMHVARAGHAALQCGGIVFVIGGDANGSSVEFLDPAQGAGSAWTATGSLTTYRIEPIAICIPSLNRILVMDGGADGTSETYNVVGGDGLWHSTSTAMVTPRQNYAATYISPNQVIIAGGTEFSTGTPLSSLESYNPQTDSWSQSPPAPMTYARANPEAILLNPNALLVSGGDGGNGTNYYDEIYLVTGAFWNSPFVDNHDYSGGSVARLPNGKYLFVAAPNAPDADAPATLFDYVSGTFADSSTNAPYASRAHYGATSIALSSGVVALVGGGVWSYTRFTTTLTATQYVDFYDPHTDAWVGMADMNVGRAGPSVVELPNGQVLVTGGNVSGGGGFQWYPPRTETVEYLSLLQLGDICSGELECSSGFCVGSVCTTGSDGSACSTNADCNSSFFCSGGQCRCAPIDGYQTKWCSARNTCIEVDECCSSADCGPPSPDPCYPATCVQGAQGGTGWYCGYPQVSCPSNQTCVVGASGPVCNTDPCSADSQCATGFYCRVPRCTAKLACGQSCSADDQCQAGPCVGGTCCNDQCLQDSDCGAGAFCDLNSVPWSCAPLGALGMPCSLSTQCGSGYCADGVCCNSACSGSCDVCAFVHGAIAGDGNCTKISAQGTPTCSPFMCNGSSDTCPTGCADDSSCDSGHYCDTAAGTCVARVSYGAPCGANRQCNTNSCTGGFCGCPSGFLHCGADTCVPSRNGLACCLDSDCTSAPGCHASTGATCTNGACNYPVLQCQSGQTCINNSCSAVNPSLSLSVVPSSTTYSYSQGMFSDGSVHFTATLTNISNPPTDIVVSAEAAKNIFFSNPQKNSTGIALYPVSERTTTSWRVFADSQLVTLAPGASVQFQIPQFIERFGIPRTAQEATGTFSLQFVYQYTGNLAQVYKGLISAPMTSFTVQ